MTHKIPDVPYPHHASQHVCTFKHDPNDRQGLREAQEKSKNDGLPSLPSFTSIDPIRRCRVTPWWGSTSQLLQPLLILGSEKIRQTLMMSSKYRLGNLLSHSEPHTRIEKDCSPLNTHQQCDHFVRWARSRRQQCRARWWRRFSDKTVMPGKGIVLLWELWWMQLMSTLEATFKKLQLWSRVCKEHASCLCFQLLFHFRT